VGPGRYRTSNPDSARAKPGRAPKLANANARQQKKKRNRIQRVVSRRVARATLGVVEKFEDRLPTKAAAPLRNLGRLTK
jgi:hypothetical protein